MMNVGLHHRGVDTQLRAVLHSEVDGCLRELPQRQSISNPFTQLAIVPILDAHQNQRAQDLLWRQSMAASVGILQTLPKIVTNRCDDLFVVVKKVRDRLQQRLKNQPLLYQLKVGTAG